MEGGLGARSIRRHHGARRCHVSLECLRGTVLLTDLLVPQGHLHLTNSRSSLGLLPTAERRTVVPLKLDAISFLLLCEPVLLLIELLSESSELCATRLEALHPGSREMTN